ncbi:MAG: hypothetical protein K5854_00855 [Prevotella sp.]|nr:hypothetical protein [Prevotella sp.]
MIDKTITLDTPIRILRTKGLLSVRTSNALIYAGFKTVGDVVEKLKLGDSLSIYHRIGKKSKAELEKLFIPLIMKPSNSQYNILENSRSFSEFTIFEALDIIIKKYVTHEKKEYACFMSKFPNSNIFWEVVNGCSQKIFQIDENFSFWSNCVAIYACYEILNDIMNTFGNGKSNKIIDNVSNLKIHSILRVYGEYPNMKTVSIVLDGMSVKRREYLSYYYDEIVNELSTRTKNALIYNIGDYKRMLAYMLVKTNSFMFKYAGIQSAVELRNLGNLLLNRANDIYLYDSHAVCTAEIHSADDFLLYDILNTCIKTHITSNKEEYKCFMDRFPNAKFLWNIVVDNPQRIFEIDEKFSFECNCLSIYVCYNILRDFVDYSEKYVLPISENDSLKLKNVLKIYGEDAKLKAVCLVIDRMSSIKQEYLFHCYCKIKSKLSTRARNILEGKFRDYRKILALLVDIDAYSIDKQRTKSLLELKLAANTLMDMANEAFICEDKILQIKLNESSFPFIGDEESLFVNNFYDNNGYLPMFYIILTYLRKSSNRNEIIARKYYGIGCPKECVENIANFFSISGQTVLNVIDSLNKTIVDKNILDPKYWVKYDFLCNDFISIESSEYLLINEKE